MIGFLLNPRAWAMTHARGFIAPNAKLSQWFDPKDEQSHTAMDVPERKGIQSIPSKCFVSASVSFIAFQEVSVVQ